MVARMIETIKMMTEKEKTKEITESIEEDIEEFKEVNVDREVTTAEVGTLTSVEIEEGVVAAAIKPEEMTKELITSPITKKYMIAMKTKIVIKNSATKNLSSWKHSSRTTSKLFPEYAM